MQNKVHMRNQVVNNVKDIMNAYKKKPYEQLIDVIKHFFQHSVAA